MDEPLLNDFEVDLDGGIYEFLEKHITKSIEDDNSRKGIFKGGRNILREICEKINTDESYFDEGSKEIARQLLKAIKTNNNIASTDLIICKYQCNDQNNVAILKMDYNTTFIHDVEVVDNKFKISIKRQDVSLPNMNQKIQKCVFVGENNKDGYDFIILDNQINSKSGDEVAQFFIETFLDGEIIIDNRTLTKILKKETENWVQKKEKEGEDLGEKVRAIINNVVHEEDTIDVKELSNQMFGATQYLKEDYIKNLEEKGLTDTNFEVDKEWVEKKFSRVKLKTDTNVEITLDYNFLNEKEMFEIINNTDGTKSIIIKNIRSIVQK